MATVSQTTATTPASAPDTDDAPVVYEDGCYRLVEPTCSNCGTTAVSKNGSDTRHPKGRCPEHPEPTGSVGVQQYLCTNSACDTTTITPSLPFVEDGYRYIEQIRKDARSMYLHTEATLDGIQDYCVDRYHVKPATSTIDGWIQESLPCDSDSIEWRELQEDDEATSVAVVENPLPTYSGVYELDEFYMTIDGEQKYRVTVWDHLMQSPVAEGIADRRTKDAIKQVVEPVLRTKPVLACLTDGWRGAAALVADELGGLHYWCMFHKICNLWTALGEGLSELADEDDLTQIEQIGTLRVGTEVRQLLSEQAIPDADRRYTAARRRFEAVLDGIEHVPEQMQNQLQIIDDQFEKYAAHLREEWLPGTTNGVERYYSLTQPNRVNHRFRSTERALTFLQSQMTLRTVKHGFVSRETSLARARELFPNITEEAVELLFTDRKQRYLAWRDRPSG